jgi:hypothetical protein
MKVQIKKRQSISNSSMHNIDIPNQEPGSPGSSGRESEASRPDTRSDLGKCTANHKNSQESCETYYCETLLARKETKAVNVLRLLVLVLLLVTATLTSVGVYLNTSNEEKEDFEVDYQANAERIIESFHDAVVRRLGAINSMATAITSHALDAKQTFPFVTIPNFEIKGSDLRVQADAPTIHWMPLVTDESRVAWEDYALANRYQISRSFQEDRKHIEMQDDAFGFTNTTGTRMLQRATIVNDGTGYHPRIWELGNSAEDFLGNLASAQDASEGNGPYLPLWQSR